jgi:hypothetical protein
MESESSPERRRRLWKKHRPWRLLALCATPLLLGWGALEWHEWRLRPHAGRIERFFATYRQLPAEARREATARFLRGMVLDVDAKTYDLRAGALVRLQALYLETRDAAILEALDGVDVYASFGMDVCGLYKGLMDQPEVLLRYRTRPEATRALARCVGVSFHEEEFAALITPKESGQMKR